ncbi:hypothetical protein CKO42_17245 [Lamprobacter modestohalophilus]|uniref:Card1 endonuclease domain-containing protein n=1 Tax=Lamprobacter modestohalophilus TaxID=1064514 RepID=A0A9X0WAT0_9GAMM|nr:hypothetical protein [Lamprobacter modestohalophilus]
MAARRLAGPLTRVSLLHSSESRLVAERLECWLREHCALSADQIALVALDHPGDEYRPAAIRATLNRHLDSRWSQADFWLPGAPRTVHLHYTGGTKAMTVHAYDSLRRASDRHDAVNEFSASYLDPDGLCLMFDDDSFVPLADNVLKMEDFLTLHGWSLATKPGEQPVSEPQAADLAMALCHDHAREGAEAWDRWVGSELMPRVRKPKRSDVPARLAGETTAWQPAELPKGDFLGGKLKDVILPWPDSPACAAFTDELAKHSITQQPLGDCAAALGLSSAKDLARWLEGQWLESAVLQALLNHQEALKLHQVLMNLNLIKPAKIEFDVIAIRGYRLFGFSCTTGDQPKGSIKQKLFEASIRARQMGGDEARTALVCCTKNPDAVQRELESEFDLKNKIRVFGQAHLATLGEHLADWIQ